jgi:hypothetical protein
MSSFDYCNPPINPNHIIKSCNKNNNLKYSKNPPNIYQQQKIIQNTVRVASSNYTMNLGALSVYQSPNILYGVNWKQMSDRRIAHEQNVVVPSTRSTKHSYTSNRPCSQSPGGKGVDIKHNSYNRYLARLKGKSVLRRGIIPPILPVITFNPALPVYGGKTFKTNIVSGYNCLPCSVDNGDPNIYKSYENNVFENKPYQFHVGDIVLVNDVTLNNNKFVKGTVLQVLNYSNYLIKLDSNGITQVVNIDSLYIPNRCSNYSATPCSDNNNNNNYTLSSIINTSLNNIYERYIVDGNITL